MKRFEKRVATLIVAIILMLLATTAIFAYNPGHSDSICVEPHTHDMSAWSYTEHHEGLYLYHYYFMTRHCRYPGCVHTESQSYNSNCTPKQCFYVS
jgi:hypothetical protein